VVFQFFRGADSGLDQIETDVTSMLVDGRHSFEVAMQSLGTDGDIESLGEEVRSTDHRINRAEEDVRRALVVHSAVHKGLDVSLELSFLLIVKKLERVGDQAKNLYDLAAEGVRFHHADDYAQIVAYRDQIAAMFTEADEILRSQDAGRAHEFGRAANELMDTFDRGVNQFIHSDAPASHAVPRALLYRYLKRIVANLAGSVQTVVQSIDRREPGTDIDE
jgi:phosphate uptake regulator